VSGIRTFCIVTASGSEVQAGDLGRFLTSVAGSPFYVIVVLRNGDVGITQALNEHPQVIQVINTPSAGISRARNLGVAWLRGQDMKETDVVSFPDDDCTYPTFLYDQVSSAIKDWDLIVGGYSEHPQEQSAVVRPMHLLDVWHGVASVGLFVRWRALASSSGFDEGLGVGSKNIEAGEDTDFVLRILANGFACALVEGVNVQHPVSTNEKSPRLGAHVAVARLHATSSMTALHVLSKAFVSALIPGRALTLEIFWRNVSPKQISRCRQFPRTQPLKEPGSKLTLR
jgi:hypothetical protein